MNSQPGTYALILQSRTEAEVQVGRWGVMAVEPGYYTYIGSAFGPGGVRARVLRHCRNDKPKRWHIDYLSELLNPHSVWYSHDAERLEHRWAAVFSAMDDVAAIRGFGCSDCRCYSHLFYTPAIVVLEKISNLMAKDIQTWSCR